MSTKESTEMKIREILRIITNSAGEDEQREGLKATPNRVIRSWEELYGGYKENIEQLFVTFDAEDCNEIVLLKNIEMYSTCEHHMLPFFGKAHIAYIPDKKIIGISKLARVLEAFARRLQIQERIGKQVTEAIGEYLQPKGSACIIEAQHFCMTSRGVKKQHSVMVTSSLTGIFKKHRVKSELLSLIKQ